MWVWHVFYLYTAIAANRVPAVPIAGWREDLVVFSRTLWDSLSAVGFR